MSCSPHMKIFEKFLQMSISQYIGHKIELTFKSIAQEFSTHSTSLNMYIKYRPIFFI